MQARPISPLPNRRELARMKILLTCHQFLPDYATGTEILTFNTAKALQALGCEVSILTGFPSKPTADDFSRFDSYEYEGIPVERFHQGSQSVTGEQTNLTEREYNDTAFATCFREYLKKTKPDLVHFFHLARLSASAIDVCHELRIPMAFTPTDFWSVCPTVQLRLPDGTMCNGPDKNSVNCLRHFVALTQSREINALTRRLPDWALNLAVSSIKAGFLDSYQKARTVRALSSRHDFLVRRLNLIDKLIVPSRLMGNVLERNGVDRHKMVFHRYGISVRSIPSKKSRGLEPRLRVGFIGTLIEHKGPHILVDAVKSLPRSIALDVQIFGNPGPPQSQYIGRLKAAASGDDRIVLRGKFPNSEIGNVMAELDVLVVPSLWHENTPLVIYSAQAAGCPVIASKVAGMEEVVQHGKNGLLFELGNVQALAALIQELAQDRSKLIRLASEAPQPKSISTYVEELIYIYDEVLDARREEV